MSKERELLRRLLENFEQPVTGRFGDLFDGVRELLSAPEPTQDEEPTLLTKEELGTLMLDWMNTPKSRDSDLYRAVQEEVLRKNGCPAPRPEFVPLTEEELVACWGMPYSLSTEELRRFARAVEKATWEKNR